MTGHDEGSKITDAVRIDIENSVLCWLASVDLEGTPSVTPKEIFSHHGDDRIVVADIASANTVRNLRANPMACVSFIDVFRQRGFKIVGEAAIIGPESEAFAVLGADLLRMAGQAFPVRHVISIQVRRIARIWAPSYRLRPELTDDERLRSAYRTYGVVPAGEDVP